MEFIDHIAFWQIIVVGYFVVWLTILISNLAQNWGKQHSLSTLLFVVIIATMFPLVVIVMLPFVLFWLVKRIWYLIQVRIKWLPNGRYLLYVYSENPNWIEYEKNHILPKIQSQAVVFNWSERNEWNWNKPSFDMKVFKHFVIASPNPFGRKRFGLQEFNHTLIVFKPWWHPQVFRFKEAYKDAEFGNKRTLDELEQEVSKLTGIVLK